MRVVNHSCTRLMLVSMLSLTGTSLEIIMYLLSVIQSKSKIMVFFKIGKGAIAFDEQHDTLVSLNIAEGPWPPHTVTHIRSLSPSLSISISECVMVGAELSWARVRL